MPRSLTDWRTPDGSRATSSYFIHVQDDIVKWWLQHKRSDLPWRPPSVATPSQPPFFNPYAIWVSEVMSQQTLMATVISYFTRWMSKFPTIEVLSRASEDEVRAVWAGMGYYRRAIFLLKGAQYLVELHRRERQTGPVTMPSTAAELLKVPGVGPYTAGAIASVCFGEPVIATDGNVVRVLSRLRGERDFDPKLSANIKLAASWGQTLMMGGDAPGSRVAPNPGGLNQGLMELGAGVCRPNSEPLCHQCPLRDVCCTLALHQTHEIPSIDGFIPLRGSRATKRHETVVCVVHEVLKDSNQQERGRFVVVRRPRDGLLGGMLEFPTLPVTATSGALDANNDGGEGDRDDDAKVWRLAETLGCRARPSSSSITSPLGSHRRSDLLDVGAVTHVFSHIEMTVRVFHVRWLDALNGTSDADDVIATVFTGASTSVEDAVCSRVAAALQTETGASTVRKRTPKRVPTRSMATTRDAKGACCPETTESRVSVLSETDVREAAASRLMLKILEATAPKDTKVRRIVKRKRSRSP